MTLYVYKGHANTLEFVQDAELDQLEILGRDVLVKVWILLALSAFSYFYKQLTIVNFLWILLRKFRSGY